MCPKKRLFSEDNSRENNMRVPLATWRETITTSLSTLTAAGVESVLGFAASLNYTRRHVQHDHSWQATSEFVSSTLPLVTPISPGLKREVTKESQLVTICGDSC